MKSKWAFIVISLLLVVGIGGKIFMDKQKEAEKIEAERMSVEALKNTFADIKSVEFKYTDFHMVTGSYSMVVKMTNVNGKKIEFDYLYWEGIEKISSYKVVDEYGVQLEGNTKTNVRVFYSNGEKGEV